jgi:hypothetical protein
MGGTNRTLQARSGLNAHRGKFSKRAGRAVLTGLMLGVVLLSLGVRVRADESDPQKVTIEGTLKRMMAAGAESTGWSVQQVESETVIDGKPISSIEVGDTKKPQQLEEFENKRVKIAGKVVYRHGVETGTQPYVEIMSIKALKGAAPAATQTQ